MARFARRLSHQMHVHFLFFLHYFFDVQCIHAQYVIYMFVYILWPIVKVIKGSSVEQVAFCLDPFEEGQCDHLLKGFYVAGLLG